MTGRVRIKFGLLLAALLCTAQPQLVACDTPVYRYAMYRWAPNPYRLVILENQPMDVAQHPLLQAIDRLATDREAPANLDYQIANLQRDSELTGLPDALRQAWLAQPQPATENPMAVVSPRGDVLYQGLLDAGELSALADSAARDRIAEHLGQGVAGVFVLVTCGHVESDEAARDVLLTTIEEAHQGQFSLGAAIDPQTAFRSPLPKQDYQFASVEVARDDPSEQWLVRSLLLAEEDLASTSDPLVFLVFGRGRAVFSCLGRGIHRDILIRDMQFVTGACACTVKEENPGIDLPMQHNWQAAADLLAARFGSEEGNENQIVEDVFFPELLLPGSDAQTVDDPNQTQDDGTTTPVGRDVPAISDQPVAADSRARADDDQQQVASRGTLDAEALEPANPYGGVLAVAAGIAISLVLLFVATLFVLRPR